MRRAFLNLWIAIAAIIIFFWLYFPTLSHYRDLKIHEDQVAKQLTDFESKIQDLNEERNLLKNDKAYLEKTIRDELGLVKPGEVVYKFVPDDTKKEIPKPAAPKIEPKPVAGQPLPAAAPVLTEQIPEPKPLPNVTPIVIKAVRVNNPTPKPAPPLRRPSSEVLPSDEEPVYPRQETR